MTLPKISIPEIEIPFEIPAFLNDYLIHFIVVIPVMILLLELYNLATKRRSISLFSLFLFVSFALFVVAFYLLDSVSGDENKLLLVYFVYASLILLLVKLLVMAVRKTLGRIILILILGAFTAFSLMQVNSGTLFSMSKTSESTTEEAGLKTELKVLQEKYDTLLAKSNSSTTDEKSKVESVEAISESNTSN